MSAAPRATITAGGAVARGRHAARTGTQSRQALAVLGWLRSDRMRGKHCIVYRALARCVPCHRSGVWPRGDTCKRTYSSPCNASRQRRPSRLPARLPGPNPDSRTTPRPIPAARERPGGCGLGAASGHAWPRHYLVRISNTGMRTSWPSSSTPTWYRLPIPSRRSMKRMPSR
jgi:hypothetical protein